MMKGYDGIQKSEKRLLTSPLASNINPTFTCLQTCFFR